MLRNFVSLPRAAALSIAVISLAPPSAFAQTVAPTAPAAETIQLTVPSAPAFARLIQGKKVWITADGARVRGRVTSLSATGLVLVEDGVPTTIRFDRIVRVEKSSHRIRNGTLAGLVVGTVVGSANAAGCGEPECIVLVPIWAGLGAAVGVGFGAIINAAKKSGDVLHDARRSTTTMSFAPILSPTRKGLAFSMTWR